jgi:hypothetical protein
MPSHQEVCFTATREMSINFQAWSTPLEILS